MTDNKMSAEDTEALVARFRTSFDAIRREVRKIIVGQDEVVEQLLLTLLVGGHCLITGLPGTAKTLLVRTLASALGLTFKRIQFTPDLMPTDITGTDILEEDQATGKRTWTFVAGPAVHQCAAGGRNQPHAAEDAVGAAGGHAGTVGHRARQHAQHRAAVLRAGHAEPHRAGRHVSAARSAAGPLPVQRGARLPRCRAGTAAWSPTTPRAWRRPRSTPAPTPRRSSSSSGWCGRCRCRTRWRSQAVALVRATRPSDASASDDVKKYARYGASIRATQFLALAAKARALSSGRYHVTTEDLRGLALPVLRHRVLANYQAESDGVTIDTLLGRVITQVLG